MKKYISGFLTAIFILATISLRGQVKPSATIDTSTTEGLLHYILQPIDKSQIPNSFLDAWGAPILPMATFNGTLSDSNRIDINLWRTLYFQLQTSYCGSGTNPLDSITIVNNTIHQNIGGSLPVPIPLLIGQYNSVKSDAFSNNLLSYNSSTNQVYDVVGRTQSPYQSDNLFAACPDINATITGSATFICKPNLIWNNTGNSISNIQIDFANGQGFQTITLNTPVTINYTDTGMVRWTIKVTLSDDSILQCYSDYDVLQASSGESARYSSTSFDAEWTFPATSYDSGANVFISYTSKNRTNTMRKPLIVVEGYDVYHAAPDFQYGQPYTYSDLVNAISSPTEPFDFNYNLDDVGGYDLIFVQFVDGTDSIQWNARVLEQVIDSVNSAKANAGSTEQDVVMGLSMGGLVARYALAEMTKVGENPQTRLLITHDSPHRGANVPLGIQYLIEMIGNVRFLKMI